jgi:hypothetical protein
MGQNVAMLEIVKWLIILVKEAELPLVIDAVYKYLNFLFVCRMEYLCYVNNPTYLSGIRRQ